MDFRIGVRCSKAGPRSLAYRLVAGIGESIATTGDWFAGCG
jgi:hypothetical protein